MDFPSRLRKLRKENNYTLKELANKFNSSKMAFSNYENDNRRPNMELIIKLADFFNVTTDYLLGKTDEKNLTGTINYQKKYENL